MKNTYFINKVFVVVVVVVVYITGKSDVLVHVPINV